MRQRFPGWYARPASELSTIWEAALFVPDANVLLHCLRHPGHVRSELLRLFQILKESLWIPYQVGLEFHRNRLGVTFEAQDAYDALLDDQEKALEKARERLRQLRAHPTIDVQKEIGALDMFLADFRVRMDTYRAAHPTDEIEGAVESIGLLFNGRVGEKWTSERLQALKKEGEDRYSKKIPPGFRDAKKDASDMDKFGDLIIWKDMIEKATAERRPVIFISDDAKEDWWWIHRGRKLGPRPELIEEFRAASGQDFHIYEFGRFLNLAAERYPEIRASVETVERSLQDDERARRFKKAVESKALRKQMRELEDEKENLVAVLSGIPGRPPLGEDAERVTLQARLKSINTELARIGLELESMEGSVDESQT